MKRIVKVLLAGSLMANLFLAGIILMGFTGPNVLTSFNDDVNKPVIARSAFVHELASVLGDVKLGERVYVAPAASIRGDEVSPYMSAMRVMSRTVLSYMDLKQWKRVRR